MYETTLPPMLVRKCESRVFLVTFALTIIKTSMAARETVDMTWKLFFSVNMSDTKAAEIKG